MSKFLSSSTGHLVLGLAAAALAWVISQPWAAPYQSVLLAVSGLLTATGAAALPQTLGATKA